MEIAKVMMTVAVVEPPVSVVEMLFPCSWGRARGEWKVDGVIEIMQVVMAVEVAMVPVLLRTVFSNQEEREK